MKIEKKQNGSVVIVVLGVLLIVYFFVMLISFRGWGYMGYYGHYHGPSFFYMGGPSMYYERSARTGSLSGPGHRGGGVSGGK